MWGRILLSIILVSSSLVSVCAKSKKVRYYFVDEVDIQDVRIPERTKSLILVGINKIYNLDLLKLPAKLKKFDFSYNDNLGDLPKIDLNEGLKVFNFSNNEFTSMESLILPSSLKKLYFNYNNLDSIEKVTFNEGLEVLDLSSNDLERLDPIFNIENLNLLYLDDNPLDISDVTHLGQINEFLSRMKSLKYFSYGSSTVTDLTKIDIPSSVKHFFFANFPFAKGIESVDGDYLPVDLQGLYIQTSSIESYADIKNLPKNLKTFSLRSITGLKGLSQLSLNENLEVLSFRWTFVEDEDLKDLTLPPKLKKLDLWKNNIETLEYLDPIPATLKVINLRKNAVNKKNKIKIERRFSKLGVRVNF